jgi:hypothetical protein
MKVLVRGAALAGAALLVVGIHAGAQIREGGAGPVSRPEEAKAAAGRPHPEVLLNTRGPEFEGGERVVAQFMLKRLDPKAAVGKVPPPKGIDGIIAYPGSRMLMVRGLKEAVAGYQAALEKADAGTVETGGAEQAATLPEIWLPAKGKLDLRSDRTVQDGSVTRATGSVLIRLPDGVEVRAQQVRVTTEDGKRRIVIEK